MKSDEGRVRVESGWIGPCFQPGNLEVPRAGIHVLDTAC